MDRYELDYARDHLAELTAKAARGEDVAIAVPGQGTFKLEYVGGEEKARQVRRQPIFGQWKGCLAVPERLFEPLSDEELSWLSGEQSP